MFVKNSTKNLLALPEVFSKKVCMLPDYLKCENHHYPPIWRIIKNFQNETKTITS